MNKKIVSIITGAFASVILGGCAIDNANMEPQRSQSPANTLSTVQVDDLKHAFVIMEKKLKANEDTVATLTSSISNILQQNNATSQELQSLKQRMSNNEGTLIDLKQSISLQLNDIEKNITVAKKVKDVNKSVTADLKQLIVTNKRAQLLNAPNPHGKKIRYVYRGDKLESELNTTSGYYYIPKDIAYINKKWVKDVVDKNKSAPHKKQGKKVTRVITLDTTQQSNQAFFDDVKVATPTQQKEAHKTQDGPKVSNEVQIHNAEIAKEIASTLASNPNVSDKNIEQQCATELLKKGIQSNKSRMYIDVCVATFSLKKSTQSKQTK